MIVIFFREKPPTPPSPSANDAIPKNSAEDDIKSPNGNSKEASGFKPAMKQLFGNKIILLLMIIFGFI